MTTPTLHEMMNVIPTLGWEGFTPNSAAKELGTEPHHIPTKRDLLRRFHQHITDTLQKTLKTEDITDAEPLDCVMEVMLCRLELLIPFRPALKRIYQDLKEDPCLLKESFTLDFLEMDWLSTLLPTRTPLPAKVLGGIYWLTVRHWIKNEPENIESAMSYMDKALGWVKEIGVFTR